MTRSGVNRRYWSGIKNVHKRLNDTSADGKAARKKYYALTENKIYNEKNFQKFIKSGKGTGISLNQVRHDFKTIRDQKKKMLEEEYKDLKKEGITTDSKRSFIKRNLHEDTEFQDIRELFNSP